MTGSQMIPEHPIQEFLWTVILSVYALLVVYLTKYLYEFMVKRKIKEKDAIYYNRKLVHIFAGGVIALVVPILFTSPLFPLLCGLSITGFTFFSHKRGTMLYWFQMKDNLNDVSFCFMWGIAIFVLWLIMDNSWIAIIPPVFMAFGDGITGIVRNSLFKKRSKHPVGNLFMAAFCIPIGYTLGNIGGMAVGGATAGIVASIVERYEIGPIDDNILITLSSSIVLFLFYFLVNYG